MYLLLFHSLLYRHNCCFYCVNFSRVYKDGKIIPLDDSLDYGGNFAHMLGFDDPKMLELMRLYVTIHRFVQIYSCSHVECRDVFLLVSSHISFCLIHV